MTPSKSSTTAVCFGYETATRVLAGLRLQGRKLRPTHVNCFPVAFPRTAVVVSGWDDLAHEGVASGRPEVLHVVGASSSRNCRSQRIRQHRCSAIWTGQGLVKVSEGVLIPSVPHLFTQMAAVLSFVELVELGYEWCGTYSRGFGEGRGAYQIPALTSVSKLRRFAEDNSGLRGAGKALEALSYVRDGAESPREAKCAMLFGLPASRGGYGLGVPALGHELKCTPSARAIVGSATVRCDLYWPAARLDLEYQSHEFHEGELRRVRDSRRANALRAMNINIVPVSDSEIESMYACDVIAETARKALGMRRKPRVNGLHEKRLRLRRQLGLPLEPRRTFEAGPDLCCAAGEGREAKDASGAQL